MPASPPSLSVVADAVHAVAAPAALAVGQVSLDELSEAQDVLAMTAPLWEA